MVTLPSLSKMYRALLEKGSSFKGIFYIGVRTTGIFCQPTCPAKKPKPENVEYFTSPGAALYAGFRPCLRCYPMGGGQHPPALVGKLIRAVEKKPGERLLKQELLSHLQIDLIKARRQFRAYTGMTLPAYHRARRMGLALLQVRKWNNAITQVGIGPKLTSDSRKAFTKTFDSGPVTAKPRNYFFSCWIDTPVGAMLAIANSEGLALLEFVDRRGLENEIKRLCYRHKCTIVPGRNPHLEQINEELQCYFSGKSLIFSVPLSFTGSDFQRRTWQLLSQIPAGKTRSYTEMAALLGKPTAVRAMARANGGQYSVYYYSLSPSNWNRRQFDRLRRRIVAKAMAAGA